MGFMDFFTSHMKYPGISTAQQNVLQDWLRRGGRQEGGAAWPTGSGAAMEQGALTDLFNLAKNAETKGTPFYESLIPSSPGALSPAAAAEKAASTDALQSQLGSERVAQLGQLGREYGGRLPASMVQSGFGSLARAGAGGATDIARRAIIENVGLGEQGVQGLAGLASLPTTPLAAATGAISGSPFGGFVAPPIGKEMGQTLSSLAGGVAGFAGLGGGGGASALPASVSGANQFGGGIGGGYGGAYGLPAGGLPTTLNRQYLPLGGPGG